MQEQARNGTGPKVLPGPSSVRLIVRGNLVMLAAGCLVVPLAFESSFKSIEDIYAGVILAVIGIGLAIGYRMNLLGSRKRKLEIEQAIRQRSALLWTIRASI